MSFWNSTHISKSRKDHKCEFCNVIIPKNSFCWNEAGTFDDDFSNYYLCERCKKLICSGSETWTDDYDNELLNFYDCLYESDIINCPKCNSTDIDIVEYSDDRMSCKIECNECDNIYSLDLSAENLLKTEIK
jgi:hypothetical protein